MDIQHGECPERDSGHLWQLPSHLLHNLVNLPIAQLQIVLFSDGTVSPLLYHISLSDLQSAIPDSSSYVPGPVDGGGS